MKKIFALILVGIIFTSCARNTFNFTKNRLAAENQKVYEWNQFVLGGIGQSSEINVYTICGSADKVKKIEVQKTFGNVVVTVLTLFIYTPSTYRVYCTK